MTSFSKKVSFNFSYQLIGRILSVILGVIVIGLVMRYLSLEEYGYYSIALAYLQIFGIIADFGIYTLSLDYLGKIDKGSDKKNNQKRTFIFLEKIFTLRFFSALLFYGFAILLSLLFPWDLIVKKAILILCLSFFFLTLSQALSAYWQKSLKTLPIALGEIVSKIILLLFIIFLIFAKASFYWILMAFALGSFGQFLVLSLPLWKKKLRFCFDFSFFKEIIRRAWPIGLAVVFNTLYFKADTLILSFYHPPQAVGLYGGAYRILEVLITIPPLFIGLVLPRLAKLKEEKNIKEFKKVLQKSFDFLLMLVLPVVVAVQVLGERVMILIGGQNFKISGDILQIVILATGILFLAELFKQLVIVLGKERKIIWFYLITTIIALSGYFVLIPHFSYWGAAWVTVFAEGLMFIFLLIFVKKQINFLPNLKFFPKAIFASLLMFLFLRFAYNLNLFILIILGGLIYLLSLYLLKSFSGHESQKWD